jgi:hypothetical protein
VLKGRYTEDVRAQIEKGLNWLEAEKDMQNKRA